MIGNDIVDLAFFESPQYQHTLYLDRVCTPVEAQAVRKSEFPVLSHAIVWASKEAAYKLFSGLTPGRHFVPKNMVTNFKNRIPAENALQAEVCFGVERAAIQVAINDQWVHAIATLGINTITHWNVRKITLHNSLNERVRAESETVRCLAKELLADSGHNGMRLEFVRKIPTLVSKHAAGTEIGVSLSHHGAFVAAAIGWSGRSFGTSPVGICPSSAATSSGEPCFTCTA